MQISIMFCMLFAMKVSTSTILRPLTIFMSMLQLNKNPWRYRGELINSFVFCQPITVVYCGQLTNESAQFL